LTRITPKGRATRLEGSFGKEKEHCHLKKLKSKQTPQKYAGYFLKNIRIVYC